MAIDRSTLGYRPCVGIVLANANGHIFAGQRLDFVSDAWQMPQGGVDKGEDAQTAALRELSEETGLPASAVRIEAQTAGWVTYELPDELIPKLWGGKYRGQKQMWFLMRLVGDESLINIKTQIPEFSRWQWMAPDALLASIAPFKRAVYEAVLAELGPKL
ncbi:MAG: RNA pyrophosphohydrolase [Paracoccaceae bacterium]